jgi:hypothetical protein
MAPSAAKPAPWPAIQLIDEEQHDRRQHRQQRRDDHFLDRGLGQHVDGRP